MKQALIIFVRNPDAGPVKTRIARTAGPERAAQIYRRMLRHTHAVTRALPAAKWVFYAGTPAVHDGWEEGIYHKATQQGTDLGERMQSAFSTLFAEGYQSVVIIGSDCMELTGNHMEEAWKQLDHHDVVIGPSADGGYYLLALTAMHNRLFEQMPWSTGQVLQQTLARCAENSLRVYLLPELHDIDDEAGWNRYLAARAAARLVFVYNAGSDLVSTVTGWMHKVLSPQTCNCNLCRLTHHHAGMKQDWKMMVEALPCKAVFLHKDEFHAAHPRFAGLPLPAVFLQEDAGLQVLLPAAQLNQFHHPEELRQALLAALLPYDLDHHTGL